MSRNITKVKLLKEWVSWERQTKTVMAAMRRHFSLKEVETSHHGRIRMTTNARLEEVMGLPYTSCGIYAAIWVTNTQVWFDADKIYHYEGFAMGENGKPYAILGDAAENDLVIEL